jgi:hypothetical protein
MIGTGHHLSPFVAICRHLSPLVGYWSSALVGTCRNAGRHWSPLGTAHHSSTCRQLSGTGRRHLSERWSPLVATGHCSPLVHLSPIGGYWSSALVGTCRNAGRHWSPLGTVHHLSTCRHVSGHWLLLVGQTDLNVGTSTEFKRLIIYLTASTYLHYGIELWRAAAAGGGRY